MLEQVRREDEAIETIVDRFNQLEEHAQRRCIARLVTLMEGEEVAAPSKSKPKGRLPKRPITRDEVDARVRSFVSDDDESYVRKAVSALTDAPEGLTPLEISERIGQALPNVHGTLRWLEKKLIVERRGERWIKRIGSDEQQEARPLTLRQSIVHVLSTDEEHWARTTRIYERTRAIRSTTTPASVQAEVSRMLRDGVIVSRGSRSGEGRGCFYALRVQARDSSSKVEVPVSK